MFPGCQVYELAPVAVIVAEPPLQIEEEEAESTIAGTGLIPILMVPGLVEVQPRELVPLTENVVPESGHTTGPPLRYV
jgi:hypothetical protein